MRHKEVCSLRESQKFSPEPAFKALPFHFWSLVDKGFSVMCSLLPLLLFSLFCCVSFCGCMNWKQENSRELKE